MIGDLVSNYTKYLLTCRYFPSLVKITELLGVQYHRLYRNLTSKLFEPKDLFQELKGYINLTGGQLSIDDSVLDKKHSKETKGDLLGWFWSGKHKKSVLGIDLLTLFYTDVNGIRVPVNRRIVDKKQGKTKNEYFREMVNEVLNWGVIPSIVTGDSWFSGEENLKSLISLGLSFLFAIKSNRTVSVAPGKYQQVSELQIPESGLFVHLRGVGFVMLFVKNDHIYAYHDARDKGTKDSFYTKKCTKADFELAHTKHWGIEEFHRCIKQVCNCEHYFFRNEIAIRNHIHLSLRAFCVLEISRSKGILSNRYQYINKCMEQYLQSLFSKVSMTGLEISRN